MIGAVLKAHRERAGWTQVSLAKRLGVTQAYLSLMESGKRRMPPRFVHRLTRLLDLPPTMLPVTTTSVSRERPTNEWFEAHLARLRYPGLAYRKRSGPTRHPEEVLLAGLAFDELEPRLVEALPWLLLHYEGLDLERLANAAKAQNLQNRLGFTVALAREVAERKKEFGRRQPELHRFEGVLESCRLAREEAFGQGHPNERLLEWLKRERSEAARHWNLLTDLKAEQLPYAR